MPPARNLHATAPKPVATLRLPQSIQIANFQFSTFLALVFLLPAALFAQISIPEGSEADPIVIRAQAANQWQQDKYEVWLLRGDCRLLQGEDVAVCQEAVFWIEHAPAGSHERSKVIAYLEGNVGVRLVRNHQPVEIRDQKWFGRFSTVREVQVSAGIVAGKPNVLPGIYQRGMEQRKPEVSDALQQNGVNPVQYIPANELPPPGQPPPGAGPLPPGTPPVAPGTRRIRIASRGDVPMQGQWQQDPTTHQAVAVASQGVTMVVEGLPVRKGSIPGVANGSLTIDISADRLVVWTVTESQHDISDAVVQDEDKPLEIYMEGHVVFREGERIVYADRMYYDAQHHVGTVLDAEMLTPAPGYEGKLRVHAAELQIIAKDHFRAQDAWFTPSRLGLPRVRVQASQAEFEEIPVFDPVTGRR